MWKLYKHSFWTAPHTYLHVNRLEAFVLDSAVKWRIAQLWPESNALPEKKQSKLPLLKRDLAIK